MRLERLTSSRSIHPQPSGHVEIVHAIFHVSDPATTAKHWGSISIYGVPVIESEDASFSLKIDDKSGIATSSKSFLCPMTNLNL